MEKLFGIQSRGGDDRLASMSPIGGKERQKHKSSVLIGLYCG